MKTILFVDDNQMLSRLSREILDMEGFRAICAYSGKEALEAFDKEDIDLLVTDFRMEGMNGLELAHTVHARNPNLPVIIVTGYGPIDGGNDVKLCLAKEELFPALLDHIRRCLAETEQENNSAVVS